ncbi:MAG: S8 family peptidase [Marinobacter sp.]|nr:S8 family peptidase [Marinobacter sp.]
MAAIQGAWQGTRYMVIVLLAMVWQLSGCSGGSDDPLSSGPLVISGTISVESRTRVDSDTADDRFRGTAIANDSVSQPQQLPSPVILGGYLSYTGGSYPAQGDGFVFPYYADAVDRYRFDLAPGQRVVLQFFPEGSPGITAPDTRATLSGAGQADQSQDWQPGDGPLAFPAFEGSARTTHDLAVEATAGGPVRYVLTIDDEGAPGMGGVAAAAEFMPGEALIGFREPVLAAQGVTGAGTVAALGVSEARAVGKGAWHLRQAPMALARQYSPQERQRAEQDTLAWIASLRQRDDVLWAEPNYVYRSQNDGVNPPGNNPEYVNQRWHYELINLPSAWQLVNNPGQGIRVAVLDTGVFSSTPVDGGNWHPDLEANLIILPGSDFVDGDSNPANPGSGGVARTSFHGTHVAGIVAAVDNDIGVIGVAPSARIVPVRVLDSDGVGTTAALINAIDWVVGDGSPKADIINLSLGGTGASAPLNAALVRARDAGIVVVAAAGNQNTSQLTYPAAFPSVIAVGAVDAQQSRASYSNFGDWVDVMAPGGDVASLLQASWIFSTYGDDRLGVFRPTYDRLVGTSMATPHVAGVIALMQAARHEPLTPELIRAHLSQGALTDPLPDCDGCGVGLINAVRALSAAVGDELGSVLYADPARLQFFGSVTTLNLDLFAVGEPGDITEVAAPDTLPDWLSLGDLLGDGPKYSLSVSIDGAQLEQERTYRHTLTFSYRVNQNSELRTLDVPVAVLLGDRPQDRNAGRHYVLLVDAEDTRITRAEAIVTVVNGEYRFEFAGVEPGEYYLVAGSDLDNNGFICENGESCAEYPVNGFPEPFVFDGERSLTGLQLTTSFSRPSLTQTDLQQPGNQRYRRLSEGNAPVTQGRSIR